MLSEKNLRKIRNLLIKKSSRRRKILPDSDIFAKDPKANKLLFDLKRFPHAFVMGCILDQQVKADKAWRAPYEIKKRLGYFSFRKLSKTPKRKLRSVMREPENLHRFPDRMARFLYLGIQRISSQYGGDASRIWTNRPSSATLVRRFLEFDGVGQKIATMAANILAKDFHIPLKDRFYIDISLDVQVRRVLTRLGIVHEGCSDEYMIYTAREMNPEYPGIFDPPLWELGRDICRPRKPYCGKCFMSHLCPSADP